MDDLDFSILLTEIDLFTKILNRKEVEMRQEFEDTALEEQASVL